MTNKFGTKRFLYVTGLLFLLSCVPIKKYRELESNYHKCIEEQELYKSKSIDYENQVKELNVQLANLRSSIEVLIADTISIGRARETISEVDARRYRQSSQRDHACAHQKLTTKK